MHPLRLILIVAAGLVALILLALGPGSFWINSFVHSEAFRREVEIRASASVGGKVGITRIDFGLLSGVTLNGVTSKIETPQGVVAAQIESVRCSYSLFALLGQRLEFNRVTVTKPQVILTQEPSSAVPVPAPPPTSSADGRSTSETASGRTSPFAIVLRTARLADGQLSLRDASGATKADLQGVQVSADTRGFNTGKDVTGTLRIATVLLPQNLALTNFSTPFSYRPGAVDMHPFAASAFDGRLTGEYHLAPGDPSVLEIRAERLDVAKIGRAANPNASTRLSGLLALQSHWHNAETGKLIGEGDAQITGGHLTGVALLRDLATALRVEALNDPVLKSVSTHFEVAEGSTRFSDLRIESQVFNMTGRGTIDPQGRLNAEMVLTLHGDAMGLIPAAVATVFSRLPGGAGLIPFHLGGTVANPQADLSTRMFLQGSSVQKVINKTIDRLFR